MLLFTNVKLNQQLSWHSRHSRSESLWNVELTFQILELIHKFRKIKYLISVWLAHLNSIPNHNSWIHNKEQKEKERIICSKQNWVIRVKYSNNIYFLTLFITNSLLLLMCIRIKQFKKSFHLFFSHFYITVPILRCR